MPLLPNIYPHFQTLLNFMINTLPKPVLIALLYRLTILHLASRIIPTIGVDTWEPEEGADDGWTDCPVSLCTGVTQLSLRLFTDVDAYSCAPDVSSIDFHHGLLPTSLYVLCVWVAFHSDPGLQCWIIHLKYGGGG